MGTRIAKVVAARHRWRPCLPQLGLGERSAKRSRVAVDPYRLGATMSTRTIAIAALVIVVVVVVILFIL